MKSGLQAEKQREDGRTFYLSYILWSVIQIVRKLLWNKNKDRVCKPKLFTIVNVIDINKFDALLCRRWCDFYSKKQLCYSNLIKVQGGQNLLTLFHFVFLFLLKKTSVMVPTGNVVTQKFV